jgi:hypothetical protein
MSSTDTETTTIDTPVPTRHDAVVGLKEAAQEVTERRESEGSPTPQLHSIDTEPFEHEGMGRNSTEDPLSVTEAGKELAAQRRQRDIEREKFNAAVLGTPPPEAYPSQDIEPEYAQNESAEALEAEAKESLERVKADRGLEDSVRAQFLDYLAQPTQAARELESVRAQYLNHLAQQFPEATQRGGLDQLAYQNPERYKQYHDTYHALDQDYRVKEADAMKQQIVQAQQFNDIAQAHDAAFNRNHPELYGPKAPKGAAEAIRNEAMQFLREQGMSDQDIQMNWSGRGPYAAALRSSTAQEALLAVARQRLAKKSIFEGRRNTPPPINVRPGIASEPRGAIQQRADAAFKKLNETGSVRDAAKYLADARRAARRGR